MLDLSAENKALCFEDSTRKPLYVFLYYWQEDSTNTDGGYWKYFTVIKDAIVLESAEISEGVLEGNNFQLGSFVIPSMKVQWQNNGVRYKDMLAVPVQEIGSECIAYFDGVITKEEISSDGQTVTAEISSLLSQKLEIDVLPTFKSLSTDYLFERFGETLKILGIDLPENLHTQFINSNINIRYNPEKFPPTLTVAEAIKQIGEYLGCHIIAQNKRVETVVKSVIEDMQEYKPSGRIKLNLIRLPNIKNIFGYMSDFKNYPADYKRIEYLQCNNNISLAPLPQIRPNNNTKIEIIFQNQSETFQYWFGAENADGTAKFSLMTRKDTFRFGWGEKVYAFPGNTLGKHIICIDGNKTIIDGKTHYLSPQVFETQEALVLLSNNLGGSISSNRAIGRLYRVRIYSGNTLIYDAFPVMQSDGDIGVYDVINSRFVETFGAVAPQPIGAFTIPYHINLYSDKTQKLKFDQIRVNTVTNDYYQFAWNENATNTYEIKDNIFFKTINLNDLKTAVADVGYYLADQNFYNSSLKSVYAPFIESGDLLYISPNTQTELPNNYFALGGIVFNNTSTNKKSNVEITYIRDKFEIECNFTVLDDESIIIDTYGEITNGKILRLSFYNGQLKLWIGDYSIDQEPTVIIPALKNQEIFFRLKVIGDYYEYSGTFSGSGNISNNSMNYVQICIGSYNSNITNFKLSYFKCIDLNTTKEYFPCARLEDEVVGLWSDFDDELIEITNQPYTEYEIGGTVIPALSVTTSGIHSMMSETLCKATNANKN